jgi:hypothetical protein
MPVFKCIAAKKIVSLYEVAVADKKKKIEEVKQGGLPQ